VDPPAFGRRASTCHASVPLGLGREARPWSLVASTQGQAPCGASRLLGSSRSRRSTPTISGLLFRWYLRGLSRDDADSGGFPGPRLSPNNDLDVLPQRSQQVHQASDRIAGQLVVVQSRDLRLREAEQSGGFSLRKLPLPENLVQCVRESQLGLPFIGIKEREISEHILGAVLTRSRRTALRRRVIQFDHPSSGITRQVGVPDCAAATIYSTGRHSDETTQMV
jgi:hypothetical protein